MNQTPHIPSQDPEPMVEERNTGRFSVIGRAAARLQRFCSWVFGGFTMVFLLSVLAIFPVLNLISLGYLMKASGRVAQTGRWRDGLIGFREASHAGGIALGIWLCCWPFRLGTDLARDAALISADQTVPPQLQIGLMMVLIVTIGHILWALARGGRLRHFLWPAPWRFISWCRDPECRGLTDIKWTAIITQLEIGSCFRIGLAGFLGALMWLAIPVWVIYMATTLAKDPGILVSLGGGMLLAMVAIYLPFLQLQYVMDPNWKNLFNIQQVRKRFQHAPFAFATGLLVTLLFSIPLYLLKIELAPRELAWLPSLFFVVFIFPARLTCGYAMYLSKRRSNRAHFIWRWICRLGVTVIGLVYGMMVFFTQYLTWHGTWSLFEQHAFMVPAPWLSL